MYKIIVYDEKCSPIFEGAAVWYVEDLTEFEEKWVPLQAKKDIKKVERYYRSKFGEIVTDFQSDDESLNIVQSVDCKVLQEKVFDYTDREVTLSNAYRWESKFLFDKLKIVLRKLKCDDTYYLVGQYFGHGCRCVELNYNRWYDTEVQYSQMKFWGNPVAEYTARDVNWDDREKSDRDKDFYTNDKDFYKDEKVETFVWIPIKEVSAQYKIKELNADELAILMMDIVGEAG